MLPEAIFFSAPRVEQFVQRPVSYLGPVLAAAAARLRPLEVIHFTARRVRRNQAIANALQQDSGVPNPVFRVSFEPRDDVVAACEFRLTALLRRPNLAFARPAGTDARELGRGRRPLAQGWLRLPADLPQLLEPRNRRFENS